MIETLQGTIRDLLSESGCNPRLVSDYDLYSASVIQKLWSAEHCSAELKSLDISTFMEPSSIVYTQTAESYSVGSPAATFNFDRYSRHVHLLIDGFFINSMSVLDTLAHEMWTLYAFQQKPSRLYIGTIRKKLIDLHPNSVLGRFLASQLTQRWFDGFQRFRHCTIHESLIVYDNVSVIFDPLTRQAIGSHITLPDDPKARPFTYKKRREATKYCADILGKIQSLVEKSHERILLDIKRNNNVFPISRP